MLRQHRRELSLANRPRRARRAAQLPRSPLRRENLNTFSRGRYSARKCRITAWSPPSSPTGRDYFRKIEAKPVHGLRKHVRTVFAQYELRVTALTGAFGSFLLFSTAVPPSSPRNTNERSVRRDDDYRGCRPQQYCFIVRLRLMPPRETGEMERRPRHYNA